ncbi:MAG: hypothetical protein JSS76_07830 [Bacteroidetes bacterium]|nr:hypothetical protein [Bacteroidota bacterium]
MKKLISIVTITVSALTSAYAQSDDTYYTNGNDAYAYSGYDNSYNVYSNDPYATSYQAYDQSYQTFYDQMAPYGCWIYDGRYGRVWLPSVAVGFSPYLTNGHWVYTDYGWTWVSDYSWGWAAFHYGRWYQDDRYGWMWVPGSEWAPAWVMWGSYSNNYCWAPIAPGYGFNSGYRPAARYWNTVGCSYISQPYVSNYVVNHNVVINNTTVNNITVINNTTIYNGGHYSAGPRVSDVERVTGHRIAAVSITASARPGMSRLDRGQIQMYRPTISRQARPNNNIQRDRTMDMNRANLQRNDDATMQRGATANLIQHADVRTNIQPEHIQMNTPQRTEVQRPVQNSSFQNREPMQRTDMRANNQPERMQMNTPQRMEIQRPMQNSSPASQPARQNFDQQRSFSQPARENVQQQRAFTQPERQSFQPVQQQRSFAQTERSAQPAARQMPEMSRASGSAQMGRMSRR